MIIFFFNIQSSQKKRHLKKRSPFFSNSKFCFFFFFEPKNWKSKVVKIDCCNLPNFFECLFYFLSGVFFLFLHREILGEWGVFQQEILQFCSTKHELGEQLYFFMFSFFFEHIYHDEIMRGNYIMENEKKTDHISERRQDERVVKYI